MPLEALLDDALSRRKVLLDDESTQAYRLFNAAADGIPGFVVERYGDVLIAQFHEDRLQLSPERARKLAENLHRRMGTRAVYRKVFVRNRAVSGGELEQLHHSPQPWIGTPVEPELRVLEERLTFTIRPYDGFSVGLFLEQRDNRRRIRRLAAGCRVLNAFSYTCAFSVAAAAGGAQSVASLDMHKRYLEWGKRNFAANGLDTAEHLFFCSDVFDFYQRARRQNRRYDLIILDPPTFSRSRRPPKTFVLQQQLPRLCRGALELLEPGGMILLCTNDRRMARDQLESELISAAAGRCKVLERPSLPVDFAGDPDYAKSVLVRLD